MRALVVLVAVLAVATAGVGIYRLVDGGEKEPCAVMAVGNKLCGDDLRAWCHGTQRLRDAGRRIVALPEFRETDRMCKRVG